MWENETFSWDSENLTFPERMQTPKPFQDPHPPVWQAAATETSAVSAGELGLGLLSFALLQPVEKMAEHIRAYRTAQAHGPSARTCSPGCATTVSACTRWCTATTTPTRPRTTACGSRSNWWYKHLAEFTLQWELPNLTEEEQQAIFPLLAADRSTARCRCRTTRSRT